MAVLPYLSAFAVLLTIDLPVFLGRKVSAVPLPVVVNLLTNALLTVF